MLMLQKLFTVGILSFLILHINRETQKILHTYYSYNPYHMLEIHNPQNRMVYLCKVPHCSVVLDCCKFDYIFLFHHNSYCYNEIYSMKTTHLVSELCKNIKEFCEVMKYFIIQITQGMYMGKIIMLHNVMSLYFCNSKQAIVLFHIRMWCLITVIVQHQAFFKMPQRSFKKLYHLFLL